MPIIIPPPPTESFPIVITAQPASVTVDVGTTAQFSITVTGTSPAYQWQIKTPGADWMSISGATDASYSVPVTSLNQGENQYRCRVSNTYPSQQTSSVARLYVTQDLYREPAKVVADIIQNQLGLAAGQVMLGFEAYQIPNNPGLYVAVSYVGDKTIASNNYQVATGDGMTEIQETVTRHTIQIDLLSFDASARLRKQEVVMALRSVYSQQLQEQYELQIARIPGEFQNVSATEESQMLNRYMTTIAVTAIRRKTLSAGYFDQFPTPEVNANV